MDWTFADQWTATVQYLAGQVLEPYVDGSFYTVINGRGDLQDFPFAEAEGAEHYDTAQLMVKGRVNTGPIQHDLSFSVFRGTGVPFKLKASMTAFLVQRSSWAESI